MDKYENVKFCSDEELREFMDSDGNRLIWTFIHKYCRGLDPEDCWQECLIDVAKALAAYDPKVNKAKKTTFVCQAIYNRCKMILRSNSTLNQELNRHATSADNMSFIRDPLYDLEGDVIERITLDERTDSLLDAIEIANLTSEERIVIRMTLRDEPQVEIGKRINASQSHVSKIKSAAIKKIRTVMEENDWDGVNTNIPNWCAIR